MTGACFIDTQVPLTPAEKAAWRLFLALPSATWRDERMMFRRVHNGVELLDALTQFAGEQAALKPEGIAARAAALRDLVRERR